MRLSWLVLLLCLPGVLGGLEDEYGENFIDVKYEREMEWVREHRTIIYDVGDHSNKRVRSLSDVELRRILQHPRSRELMGIDEANISYTYTSSEEDSFTMCIHGYAFDTYKVTRAHRVPDVRFFTDLWCRRVTL